MARCWSSSRAGSGSASDGRRSRSVFEEIVAGACRFYARHHARRDRRPRRALAGARAAAADARGDARREDVLDRAAPSAPSGCAWAETPSCGPAARPSTRRSLRVPAPAPGASSSTGRCRAARRPRRRRGRGVQRRRQLDAVADGRRVRAGRRRAGPCSCIAGRRQLLRPARSRSRSPAGRGARMILADTTSSSRPAS